MKTSAECSEADTDRSYKSFAQFRSVLLYPHDFALMTFYEFYAMRLCGK